jgi:quercetin dioxygenase-like cupin family protein
MGIVHRFLGEWGRRMLWEGSRSRSYNSETASGVTETWLIGKNENAQNFAIRYYEIEPGRHSRREQHPYDHGMVFLRGAGQVRLGEALNDVRQGDVVYIAPDLDHQIVNTGDAPLGFLCVIPARRAKQGKIVWAEEGLEDLLRPISNEEQETTP